MGAYLRLRERRIITIGDAVEVLCPGRRPTAEEFDVIADGLWLIMLELEDEINLEHLDLEAVQAALAETPQEDIHRVMARPPDSERR